MGIDPDRTAALAWLFAGLLAGLGGVLLSSSTNLHPYVLSLQMLPAFVAALIGGLESLPGAVVGSVVVGVAQGMVPAFASVPLIGGVASQAGVPELVLTVVAMAVMYARGHRISGIDVRSTLAAVGEASSRHSVFDMRLTPPAGGWRRVARFAVLAVLVGWPLLGDGHSVAAFSTYTILGTAILSCE